MNNISVVCVSLHVDLILIKHVESILSLGYKGLEVVVVSTESIGVDLLRKINQDGSFFSNKVISIIDLGKGIYSAMNLGADNANNDYIIFSNPGDELLCIPPIKFEADLECFPVSVYTDEMEFKYNRYPVMRNRIMPGHQGMFFLKKSFFKLNGYNSLLKFSGDLDLYLKFRRHMDISYHNEPIVSKFILGGVSNNIKYLLVRKMERFSVLLNNWKILKISDIFCL